jgi:dipeptidyl aminopeptidase/acylaminoacyl peptidase
VSGGPTGCDETPVEPVPDDGARKLFDIPNADEVDPERTPDGRYILFVESYGQDYGYERYLSRYDLGTGEITRITDDGNFPGSGLAISPDGKYLAYQNTGICILPMDGGEPFQVSDDALAFVYSWKPDSTAVVYGTFSGMYGLLKEVDVSTGVDRVLLSEHIKDFVSGPKSRSTILRIGIRLKQSYILGPTSILHISTPVHGRLTETSSSWLLTVRGWTGTSIIMT